MELNEMTLVDVNERLNQLETEVREAQNIDVVKKATEEKRSLLERKAELEDLEQRNAEAAAIQAEEVPAKTVETILPVEERKTMENVITRNSVEYINAYAQYVKTGDATEVRSLLTENVDGNVAVPDLVVGTIQTAWDKEPVLAEVKKTFLKGNVKVGFEISSTGAVEHTEGGSAVSEEELVLGIAKLEPVSIKKWISVSDEALDLAGADFLNYIYSELGYQIAKKLADEIVADIVATTSTGSSSVPAQAVIKAAAGLNTIAEAVSKLSDEATNPVIVMNKQTYATFKGVQAAANYGQDVFDGLKVIFNNSLAAYDSASEDATYAIVGDLGRGMMVNFPNGQDITFKFDDKSLMTADLVKVLGRMYAGHAVVAPKCFTKVTKPSIG